MADNVAITAGTGTDIATDQVTGTNEHVQLMKLAISTDGSRTLVPADSTNGIDVDVTRVSGNVTVVQATAANLNATVVGSGSFTVAGDVADDGIDSGNPIKIGAFAEQNPSSSIIVADGDRTNVHADIDGILLTKPFTSYGDILVERLSNTDGASTASTVFGATVGARNFITTIAVYNDSTTNGFIDFRDGTAGTVLFTLPLPAKGGAVTNFPMPLRQTTANTAFAFDVSAALTTVYISFIGFKSKV